MEKTTHKTLSNGLELACMELPARHAAALDFRILAGTAHEPADALGLARLIQETIDLGTERYDGRALADAFDEIGASHGGYVGRELTGYQTMVLPEFLDRVIELHAEFLRRPTFPEDKVAVAVDLTKQELNALEDDPGGLTDKLLSAQVFGPVLGRHVLGEPAALDRIQRRHLLDHWRTTHYAGRLQVAAAGKIDLGRLTDSLEKHFAGFGSEQPAGRAPIGPQFAAKRLHQAKELEQQQIGIAFPGVAMTDPQYPAQRVILALLSGGMSSRLFTEVREKQGLVYWVSAWGENPRGSGMIFLGASTTPERCGTTYTTLLREVDRLGEDLTEEELTRAKEGVLAKVDTQGELTRSRCGELIEDLFQFGRPRPIEEKIARIKSVTIADIQRYLAEHPRDALSVVTLGPRELNGHPSLGAAPGGKHA